MEEIREAINSKENKEIVILRAPAKDFLGANDEFIKKGVYVVVGSFRYEELARKYSEKVRKKGYSNTSWFYSKDRAYNYVFMFKKRNLQQALVTIDEAKREGSSEAWLLVLTE